MNKLRTDWYQDPAKVILTIYVKNATNPKIGIMSDRITWNISDSTETHFLYEKIDQEKSYFKTSRMKIEVFLLKINSVMWSNWKKEENQTTVPLLPHTTSETTTFTTSSGDCLNKKSEIDQKLTNTIDENSKITNNNETNPNSTKWDDFEKNLEEEPPAEGDAALKELFEKIYKDATPETRRAMNKSYQESNGTVLSTNWNDIGKKKTEISPPDSMEYKKWD